MIQEDYVSFGVAKLLKEKGFEPPHNYRKWLPVLYTDNGEIKWGVWRDDWYPRITLQMAIKWLREVKRCIIVIIPKWFTSYGCAKYAYSIWADDNLEIDGETDKTTEYGTYKKTCEEAIKYCLKNLI